MGGAYLFNLNSCDVGVGRDNELQSVGTKRTIKSEEQYEGNQVLRLCSFPIGGAGY